jgi:dTDP-4-amino-4,6-dideoxygalactose transaminase
MDLGGTRRDAAPLACGWSVQGCTPVRWFGSARVKATANRADHVDDAMATHRVPAPMTPWAVRLGGGPLPAEDRAAVAAVLRSGWLTMGPRTLELEAACAEWFGTPHAVATSSDAAALHLVLDALGVGAGDEVVVPAVGGAVAAQLTRRCGAEPVLADVLGPADPRLDPADAAARVGPRTRAVVVAHVLGLAPAHGELAAACAAHRAALVELLPGGPGPLLDGAVGVVGLLPGGALGGEAAGLVVTRDDELAAHARSRRSHAMTSGTWARHTGRSDTYDVEGLGFNYRIDEQRAVLAAGHVRRAAAAAERRRVLAAVYCEVLSGAACAQVAAGVDAAAPHALPLVVAPGARDALRAALAGAAIETAVPRAPAGALPPRAAQAQAGLVGLPLHAGLDAADAEHVAHAVVRELGA